MSSLFRKEKRTRAKLILSKNSTSLKFNKCKKSMKKPKLKYKRSGKNLSNFKIFMIIFCNLNKNRKRQKNNSKSKKNKAYLKVRWLKRMKVDNSQKINKNKSSNNNFNI